MPVKTILLHMTDDDRNEARLAVAATLARRFQAFVDVVYVASPTELPAAVSIRGDTNMDMADAAVIAQHKAAVAEKATRQALKACSYSWTIEEGDHLQILADHSITADIAVVTVPDPDPTGDSGLQHVHERLPLVLPCPVLILPRDWAVDAPVGRHPVIAWKAMRESSVALRASLPLLAAAEKVTVMTIDSGSPGDQESVKDLLTYLGRYGIAAGPFVQPLKQRDIGDVLLGGVHAVGGDMLIMGAYGHSRWRELVLGSATRAVLRELDVPVMMAH